MMTRKKLLVALTVGLVAAASIGGAAAQALTEHPSASPADSTSQTPVAPTTAATSTPSAQPDVQPASTTHIDGFYLPDLWKRFRAVAMQTMGSCMVEAGLPFDDTAFDGMPQGLSDADQEAWRTAAVPCGQQGAAAATAAEASYVPTAEERAAALAFATQYQVWIDEMRSCMADRGHDFVGAVDMTLQTAPYPEDSLATGMPDGLSPQERHVWILDATGYDSSFPETEQSTWEASCGFVADAAYGGPGH